MMEDGDMPKGAERVTKDLDLLVELDEPEQFVWAALNAVSNRPRWKVVTDALLAAEKELAAKNEPSPKRDTSDAPPEE
jgi:hypothetical protein